MLFGLPPIHADYTDYTARAAIVEGYNTNTYQAQDDPTKPIIVRHPSLFTGIDGVLQARITTSPTLDLHDFRVQGRLQHYEPIASQCRPPCVQTDDGSVNAAWISRMTLSSRTILSLGAAATVTSVNSSHISDGTLFVVDPTQIRRTYYLTRTDPAISYALAPTWRLYQRLGLIVSGTIDSAGTPLSNGTNLVHRGLDYVQVESDTMLLHDLTQRTVGDLRLLLQNTESLYLLDLTTSPPQNIGPYNLMTGTLTAGFSYVFTPELTNRIAAGATIASPPPPVPGIPVDPRLVIAPAFIDQLYYTREFWYFTANAAYQYGSVNPRIGSGPGGTVGATLVGTPYRRGNWRKLAVMGNVAAGHAILVSGVGATTTFDTIAASAQIRYSINHWLGLLAGYDIRYASITSTLPPPAVSPYLPPLLRHVFFIGLSGYWSTDPTTPPLTQFQAPVAPPL